MRRADADRRGTEKGERGPFVLGVQVEGSGSHDPA